MFGSIWVSTSLVLEVKILKLSPSCGILVHQHLLSGFGNFAPGLWYTEETKMDSLCQTEEGTAFRCSASRKLQHVSSKQR